MGKKKRKSEQPLHFLKEWREFRSLTQEQLASEVGTDKSVISLLESGGRGLSDKWARRLAGPLRTSAGMILDHDPNRLPTSILEIWGEVPEDQKDQARAVLETFRKRKSA